MTEFEIIEVDRDYRTVTNVYRKEFKSKKDAQEYCEKKSWAGYYYFVKELNIAR